MLTVSLSDSTDHSKINIVATDLLALADTGADVCYVDIALAERFNLKRAGNNTSFSAAGSVNVPVYLGAIILQDNTKLYMAMVGSDLQKNGFRHQFLIGMEGLRYFKIVMKRSSEEFSLLWAAQ